MKDDKLFNLYLKGRFVLMSLGAFIILVSAIRRLVSSDGK